jgi:hypothetical protein
MIQGTFQFPVEPDRVEAFQNRLHEVYSPEFFAGCNDLKALRLIRNIFAHWQQELAIENVIRERVIGLLIKSINDDEQDLVGRGIDGG